MEVFYVFVLFLRTRLTCSYVHDSLFCAFADVVHGDVRRPSPRPICTERMFKTNDWDPI